MLRLIKYIILFVFIPTSAAVIAQTPGTKIFTLNGPGSEDLKIHVLYQNQQGYILAGTSDGLYRFDGIDFYRYAQAADVPASITAICDTAADKTWIGFENGNIGILQGNHIALLHLQEGFPKKAIKKIVYDKTGTVWIATAGEGVYYVKNKHMYNINTDDGLSDNYVYDIVLNANGTIKAATDRGLNIITIANNKKNIRVFSAKNGLPDNIVRSIYETANGYAWLGMQDAGIVCYNKDFVASTATNNWQYGQVNDVLSTSSQVFIATESDGLIVYDYNESGNITTLSFHDSQLKKISGLLRDRESNIWAAGDNFLMRTNGSNIEMLYTLSQAETERVHCLLQAKDKSILYNTVNGICLINREGNQWNKRNYKIEGIGNSDISALYEDSNGKIWIGTTGSGIVLLDLATGAQHIIKEDSILINSNIISISGKDNDVWISSLEGIVHADILATGIKYKNYVSSNEIGSNYINYIFPDNKNRIWFATDGKGLKILKEDKFKDINPQSSKYGNVIYRIVSDSLGNIWYSTYKNGVIKYNGKTFHSYTSAEGLSDMNITGLASIRNNVIALHHDKLDIISAKNGVVAYIDKEQGIKNINTDLNAYTTDTAGNLYFLSDSIICRYHASYYTSLQPTILIDNIQLYLQDINAKNGHTFNFKENNISFHYTGLYYSQPDKITYQYKLEGYDKDWISTKDKIKNFPQLPPATYRFRVRASLNNNFALAQEADFEFTITKPFWQTLWFIIACIVLTAGGFYTIIKLRERSINKYNRLEKEKIRSQLDTLRSQINPHFLFNSFNTLISEIEENPEDAVTYVEKLSDFYRSIVMNREKDLILLEEEFAILNDYIFIQQKRFGKAVQIINTVTTRQAKSLYIIPLALQLLIENAIKHNVVSLEKPLKIELYIDGDECLIIKNNISKKLNEERGSRMGLQNIQKRYELITRKTVIIENDANWFIVKIPLLKNAL
ncbi:hypothetical protein BH11BAC6_BH11BAC6_00850 [soil metagenome]